MGKGKHSVFIGFLTFFAPSGRVGSSWVVLAAAHFGFREVQGIRNTPSIISPLAKSHEMVFQLALPCDGFPNPSYFQLPTLIFEERRASPILLYNIIYIVF